MKEFILRYWIQVGFGAIIGFLTYSSKFIIGKLKKEHQEQLLIRDGVVALLHNSLYQECQKYITRGYILVSELNNLDYLYRSYHNLGGNGTGTELYNRCKLLPIRSSLSEVVSK